MPPPATGAAMNTFPYATAHDATFEQWGDAGTFTPDGGAPVAVTVIVRGPAEAEDFGELGIVATAWTARIRVSELAAVAQGDGLVVPQGAFTVKTAEMNPPRTLHMLDLAGPA